MDGGASVIAFVTIGVQSAKIIYDTLSAVKEGPVKLAQALNDVKQLEAILSTLQQRHTSGQQYGQEFQQHMQECSKDLAGYEKKLGKLTISANDQPTGRLWKKIKIALGEKNLSTFQSRMATHVGRLNLYLGIFQSDSTQASFESLSKDIQTNHAEENKSHVASFQGITMLNQKATDIDLALGQVKDTIGRLSTSMSGETREILEEVRKLTYQLEELSLQKTTSLKDQQPEKVDGEDLSTDGADQRHHAMEYTSLQTIISRLCSLVDRETTRLAMQAHLLTDDKELLCALIELADCVQLNGPPLKKGLLSTIDGRMCSSCRQKHLDDIWSHLQNLYDRLKASKRISLSSMTGQKTGFHIGTVHNISHSLISYDIVGGKMNLEITTKYKKGLIDNFTTLLDAANEDSETIATVSVIPKKPGPMVRVSIRQYCDLYNTVFGIPVLMANRTIPNNSPVFRLVETGKVEELQKLLMKGYASLRDHDELGASLLQYATQNLQVEMCKFLVENGADLDHTGDVRMAKENYRDLSFENTVLGSVWPHGADVELDAVDYQNLIGCWEVLFKAGADPTLAKASSTTYFHSSFFYGMLESMKIFLDHGEPFANIHTELGPNKDTPFLRYCKGGRWTVEGFRFLLRRGANMQDRDSFGQTCLHLCVCHNGGVGRDLDEMVDALTYLVGCGADISWIDSEGWSVSQAAYAESDALTGCRPGDVWDAVLAELGHDVSEFREDHPRIALYRRYYTHAHFLRLWEGKEELCPYYYDDLSSAEIYSSEEWETTSDSDQDSELEDSD